MERKKLFEVVSTYSEWDSECYGTEDRERTEVYRAPSLDDVKIVVDELVAEAEKESNEEEEVKEKFGAWKEREGECFRERERGRSPRTYRFSIREVEFIETHIHGVDQLL